MKNSKLFGQTKWKYTVFLTMFLLLVAGTLSAQQVKLDRAVARTAAALEGVLPQKAKVAVLNFTSPTTAFSDYVVEELTGELVNGNKLTVVDRRNLELITQEMKLQLSGEVSDASAQAIGKKLGAQSIISGSLTNMGTFHRFRIKAINVETAAIQTQVSYDIQNDDQVTFLLSGNVPAQTGARPSSGQANNQAASTVQVYKVGDKGPAGGWIFYDKGRVTNGWRYLEAAPNETEFTAAWGETGETVGTSTGIGAGKQNAGILIKYLREKGKVDGLAQVCDDLFIGGFDGWFLPSKDELDLMYKNLKAKKIGGFGDSWYWSSSEHSDSRYSDKYAWSQKFSNGDQSNGGDNKDNNNYWNGKTVTYSVRVIRQF